MTESVRPPLPSITVDPDTGYGFIDSTWGRVELDPHDTIRATERIGTAIHEAAEKSLGEPLADTTRVLSSFDDNAAAARRAIEEFAAEMRARSADITEHRPSRLHRIGTVTKTFHVTIEDDESYTLFDVDGRPWLAVDPANWVDTIPPLNDIEET